MEKSMKTKRIIAFIMALVITFSLFAFYGPGSIRTSAQSDLLTYANFSVKDNNGNAKGPGGLYKPQKDNTILYWGSSELQAKDQTLKFTGTLTSPSDNYDKTQFMVSLRAENMLNPWDTMTAYWILLDNSCVIVRDGKGNTLFQTDDDRFSNVPGYSDTRYMLISLIDWCEVNAEGTAAGGTRKSFYNRSHDYEFSAVNEEGGVRLIAKIDGMTILNWLDTANTVDAAGGFSVRTEDVYALDISGMTFAGDDGQTVNLLTEENIGKLDSNTASFGGYASASQWTMPLMNGGMGEIYADTALLDATVELDLRVDNPFQSESWILNLFLRDPTPNAFPWDNQSEFYQVTVLKDQMQFYRKLASGTELIDTLYFGIGSGEEWKYWSTAHHLKLTASTSKDGDVRFSVYLDHSSTELMNAGGSAGVTDSSRKITTAGGIGIWGNNYIERNADTGIYSYAQSVYVNNLTATGSALPPEEPNDTETMYDLLKGNYMLDYYFGSSYQGESNTIAIGPHGNTGTISYDEKNILNQYIDLTLSNTGADGWHNMVYLRDQAPGYAAWEKENLGEGATATFYNLVFSGEKEVALYAYVDGSPTLLSQKNLEGISFLDQNQVSLRIECEDNEAGNPVIRIFDAAGSLLFRYEDTVKTIPNAGGFTIVSDTGAGKNTTIYRLKANVVWREPTIFEQPVDSDEEPAAVSGMQDLVENSQILSTRFPVTCTGKKIDLAGATANSGDIPRIYAEFLNDAAPQVVEMTLKYNSYQTNDNVESDWLGALILADDLPGYANWDPERTEGNGGYLFNMCKNEIMVWRVSSASSMELVTSYALPENFWDSEHTLR